MDDRDTRERGAAAVEARRGVPSFAPRPADEFRQDLMVRYLQAMASHAADAGTPAPAGRPGAGPARRPAEREAKGTALQVDHLMRRSVVTVSADTPLPDIARMLARRRTGAVPVVDGDRRVIGVVAESDLLARVASLAGPEEEPGLFGRLLGRRQPPGGEGTTAASLMTTPPLTVHPWTGVVEAARMAARRRVRQVFVVDHKGRLAGVVSRNELLQALVRDDEAIREEIRSRVLRDELRVDPARVTVGVRNGTVTLTGSLDEALILRLTQAVARIPDVTGVEDRLTVV
ncbi:MULTISPECIES: CBS domain-containing protein [unclassified Streptomyces]|uniref:BON domain-containing protein n=1 Tax=unclassified Streptomyces TaxID=2593676 RepID=UPI001F04C9C9|nr:MULTISPECIES: CBS domain-containing protein [unclassified Streptomyces]MCH0567532.1 CBS domain-containing protein [Streptomyces sp. MUM 2J]MCH0573449.1 CBS domain-containing protein [Streptomyces sp. MUM 136J]